MALARIVLHGMAALVLTAAPLAAGWAQPAEPPEALLQTWQAALARDDYPAYVECLHSATREVPEYGSEEAMAFWSEEMEELRRKGFAGRFELEVVTVASPRFPPGSVRAYPIVGGQPIREAIVLIREAGHWKILRLFS